MLLGLIDSISFFQSTLRPRLFFLISLIESDLSLSSPLRLNLNGLLDVLALGRSILIAPAFYLIPISDLIEGICFEAIIEGDFYAIF